MQLSVYDGDEINAASSWEHYNSQGLSSDGVIAVTIEECECLGLKVVSDPQPGSPHHVLIEFGRLSRSRAKRVAQRLTAAAIARGWLFRTHGNP